MDIANAPPDFEDSFGVPAKTVDAGISRIRYPLLAFFAGR